MKFRKKSYLFFFIVFSLIVVFTTISLGKNTIKASENDSVTEIGENGVSSNFDPELLQLPKTEEELQQQENITVPQMEAYMEGGYLSSKAANGKITGSLTDAEYQAKYAVLNRQQNTEWNMKYNFRPETNVVRVFDFAGFKAAYENNAVSKIILDWNIIKPTSGTNGGNTSLRRTESIEIDGQGFLLEMRNSSINVDDLTSLAAFGRRFSDVPVFHMHDIQIANNSGYGSREGDLGNAWSFVNGRGEWGPGPNTGQQRGLWRYRIGNIFTPYDVNKKSKNQRVGGRLIGGNRAEISMYGYNTIVTGAENFYTGGMSIEPFTFYKGTNADYDYSVVWFIDNTGVNDNGQCTGTRRFNVGESGFVYLNYTASGTSYPAVYNFFDEINIGKNATYNANMPGSAAYFNVDNASFTAEEGSTVNLLSRAGSRPTVQFGAIHSINSGSQGNPTNTKYEFKPKSNVFIVGNNSGGIISYNVSSRSRGNQFILDSPETFDIRNMHNSTVATNAFLADESDNRGTNQFIVKNSDISLWNNQAAMDGSPTYDYSNVGNFTVTNASSNGGVSSTDTNLSNQYTRPTIKRISGMNSIPELIWTPVTDADYRQRGQVLLGYTAVGGSDPFDEDGNAKVKPLYADNIRKAYIDFKDTLGNQYTSASESDGYVHWNKANHGIPGFQIANQNMLGTPYRATIVNNELKPYRVGEETATPVLDVTPPEPAKVIAGEITNATKQLIGIEAEAKAKIYVNINGIRQVEVGVVNDDGSWQYNLPKYLNAGDTVQIFLEDNAPKIDLKLEPAAPITNTATGNINPNSDFTYRDAVFKAATKYTVKDVLPDKPKVEKTVKSYRENVEVNNTQVGDILFYRITATNNKPASYKTVWKNVKIKDAIPIGTSFDSTDTGIKINDLDPVEGSYVYDPTGNGDLIFTIGDLATGESATVTFKVTVTQKAVGTTVTNKAKAIGESPRESGVFVPGPENPDKDHEIYEAETLAVNNPGGTVFGVLEFVSAPTVIDFGTQKVKPKMQRVNQPTAIQGDLTIQDSRASRKPWRLTARISTPLSNGRNTISGALRYVYKGKEIILSSGAEEIARNTNLDNTPYKVNSTWSESGDGLKLQTDSGEVKSTGNYKAVIEWELTDAP